MRGGEPAAALFGGGNLDLIDGRALEGEDSADDLGTSHARCSAGGKRLPSLVLSSLSTRAIDRGADAGQAAVLWGHEPHATAGGVTDMSKLEFSPNLEPTIGVEIELGL